MIVVQLVGVAHLLCRGVDWLCCGCWPVPWNVYWLVLIGGGEGCVGRSTIKNQSFSAMCNWGSQQAKQLVAGSSARANSFSVWRSCRCTQQGLPTQTMHFWKANPLKWPYVWMSYPSKMGNLINDPCKVNLFERHAVSVKLDFMLWPTPWGSCRQSAGPTSYSRMSGAHISWKDPSFGCLHSPGSSSSPCADSTESNSSCKSSLRLPKTYNFPSFKSCSWASALSTVQYQYEPSSIAGVQVLAQIAPKAQQLLRVFIEVAKKVDEIELTGGAQETSRCHQRRYQTHLSSPWKSQTENGFRMAAFEKVWST